MDLDTFRKQLCGDHEVLLAADSRTMTTLKVKLIISDEGGGWAVRYCVKGPKDNITGNLAEATRHYWETVYR